MGLSQCFESEMSLQICKIARAEPAWERQCGCEGSTAAECHGEAIPTR